MDAKKRKRLEAAGWREVPLEEFLGLTEEERAIVEENIKRRRLEDFDDITLTVRKTDGRVYAKCTAFGEMTMLGDTVTEALEGAAHHIEFQLAQKHNPKAFPVFDKLTVELERDEFGSICVTCKEMPGAITCGDTIQEALTNAGEAIQMLMECGDVTRPVPAEVLERVDAAVESARKRIAAGEPSGEYVGDFSQYADDDQENKP